MKRMNLFLCLGLTAVCPIFAQSLLFEDGSHDKRAFQTQPDTDEWRSLETRTDMLTATALDPEALAALPTDQLVRRVLDWPMYGDLFAFNNPQEGMARLIEDFNGLSALVSRADAGSALLGAYKQIDPYRAQSFDKLVDRGKFTLQLAFLETLISHPSVLAQMTSAERNDLMVATLENYHAEQNMSDLYSGLNTNTMGMLLGRALRLEAAETASKALVEMPWLDGFLAGRDQVSPTAVADFIQHIESLLKR